MEAVFLRILNMSITAGWLVLAVVLLRLLLKKAPKVLHCVLWILVAVRLLCPFSFESLLSLIPSAETVPPDIIYETTLTVDTGVPVVDDVVNPVISQSSSPAVGYSVNPLQAWSFVAAWVWIVGIFCMILYAVISYLRLRKKVTEAIPLRDTVWLCDRISTPFILGILRPRIYLPSSMNEQDMTYVLAHENAHLKRRDHWWKPLGFALLAVYWFHPLLWLAYILLCKDIELACDERVIKEMDVEDKKAYSGALLSCSVPRRMIAACPLAFGEVGVKNRIKNVLHYKKPAFWIIVVAVIAAVVTAVCFLTDPVRKGLPPNGTDIITLKSGTDLEGISLEIVSVSFAEEYPQLTIKWINDTDAEATFGEEFYIRRKVGFGWRDCRDSKHGYAWNAVAWGLPAGGYREEDYYLGDMNLSVNGTYRFESECHTTVNGENMTGKVWIEFKLQTADNKTDNEQPSAGEVNFKTIDSGADLDGIFLKIEEISLDENDSHLVIRWKNDTAVEATFGLEFYILQKTGTTWTDCRDVKEEYEWQDIAWVLEAGGEITEEYYIGDMDLKTGETYRFESECHARVDGESLSCKVWIEFELLTTDAQTDATQVQKDNDQPTGGETQTSQTTTPKRQNNTKLTVTSSGSEVEGLSLELVSAKFEGENPQLAIEWKNTTLSWGGFGKEFYIYRKEDGKWVDCRTTEPYSWQAIKLLVSPMGNAQQYYDLDDIDLYADGIYRFESKCGVTVNGKYMGGKVWLEFELQTTNASADEAAVSVIDTTAASVKAYSYVYKDSPEQYLDPCLILTPDTQTFSFNYSHLSSYMARGNYSADYRNQQLVLRTQDDYERVYVFDIQDGTLVFNAEASSPMPRYKYDGADGVAQVPVPGGAVFTLHTGGIAAEDTAYTKLIESIRNENSDDTLDGYMRYFYKDIDDNGVNELCVTYQSELTVYTLQEGKAVEVGRYDFYTGTLRMFSSEKAQYPGIFYFVAGGGFENYRYLTIKDGELSSIDLWAENYGFAEEGDPERIVTYTTDKEIIAESKALYENNKDIQRQSFIPVE